MNDYKLRLLHLLDLFKTNTNEMHPIKMPEILDYLEDCGIQSERKAIYSDIEALQAWGMDIIYSPKSPTGYFLSSSDFDIIEVKILIDALSSSEFLTKKKTDSLNSRLLNLINNHDSHLLKKQILLNSKKFKNEQIFYSLDTLQSAIHNNMSIQFKYFDTTFSNEKKYRKNASYYSLIPYALLYENQRYYCIGYSAKYNSFSHYRVDKMDTIKTRDSIEKKPFNLQKYKDTNFNMSLGSIETITLEIDESLINTLIDSFGNTIIFQKQQDCIYTVTLQTTCSPTFIGWLLQFQTKIKVISPTSLIDEITSLLKNMLSYYTH